MRPRCSDDRGAVTAELAIGLPVVVLVLGLCLGGAGAAATQLRAHDVAADVSRLLGRGEPVANAERLVVRTVPNAQLAVTRPDDLVCVDVRVEHRILLAPFTVTGSSCALDGGR